MKSNFNDISGQFFGLFEVLHLSRTFANKTYWIVRCECGVISEKMTCSLRDAAKRNAKKCMCKTQRAVKQLTLSVKEIEEEAWTIQDWIKPTPKRKCRVCSKNCTPSSYFYCATHSAHAQAKSGDIFDQEYAYHG